MIASVPEITQSTQPPSAETAPPTSETTPSVPPTGATDLIWVMMTNGSVTFMFQTFESLGDSLSSISREDGGSLLFYIRLKNIRTFFDQLKDKVNVLHGLQKTFYGATEFSITDNNNYVLTFAEDEG
jgi:uncharacterized glyoxalase superfamily protein PhnB